MFFDYVFVGINNIQAIFSSLDLIQKIKSQYAMEESICKVAKQ